MRAVPGVPYQACTCGWNTARVVNCWPIVSTSESFLSVHNVTGIMAETVSLRKVYRELLEIKQRMLSREEFESKMETLEILHNADTMRQLKASEEDMRMGRTKRIRNVKYLLADLE